MKGRHGEGMSTWSKGFEDTRADAMSADAVGADGVSADGVLVEPVEPWRAPDSLAALCLKEPGLVLLRSQSFEHSRARYSFLAVCPFLTLRARGSRCELSARGLTRVVAASPWSVIRDLMARYEASGAEQVPLPLGGCFGYWGYGLRTFVEPRLPARSPDDLGLPDCWLGFYDSLLAFDHRQGKCWIIAAGLAEDGSRSLRRARDAVARWRSRIEACPPAGENGREPPSPPPAIRWLSEMCCGLARERGCGGDLPPVESSFTREGFLSAVERAREHIFAGDIFQLNLSQRLSARAPVDAWTFYRQLSAASPAPFSAYLDCGGFSLCSSSPELFLRMDGPRIVTRPIKGTRPRGADPEEDGRLRGELQESAKEMAELIMITDLLRNDVGRLSEFGSVRVPEIAHLERFAQVYHLVSTVEGRLRPDVSHADALASCFPGGSISGAPKIRALEIIDELEPVARGPYTGSIGYLGFNRRSQLSIIIRTAIHTGSSIHFHVGAGIVADSVAEAEYDETLAKAAGFLAALAAGDGLSGTPRRFAAAPTATAVATAMASTTPTTPSTREMSAPPTAPAPPAAAERIVRS